MNTPTPRRTLPDRRTPARREHVDRNSRLLSAEQPVDHPGDDHAGTTLSLARTGAGTAPRTLLSRAEENYYYGGRRDLEVDNTDVLARMISELNFADVQPVDASGVGARP